MTIKVIKRFFNQNYTNFSFLLPPIKPTESVIKEKNFALHLRLGLKIDYFYKNTRVPLVIGGLYCGALCLMVYQALCMM